MAPDALLVVLHDDDAAVSCGFSGGGSVKRLPSSVGKRDSTAARNKPPPCLHSNPTFARFFHHAAASTCELVFDGFAFIGPMLGLDAKQRHELSRADALKANKRCLYTFSHLRVGGVRVFRWET